MLSHIDQRNKTTHQNCDIPSNARISASPKTLDMSLLIKQIKKINKVYFRLLPMNAYAGILFHQRSMQNYCHPKLR